MSREKIVYESLNEILDTIRKKVNNGKQLGRVIPRSQNALKLIEEQTVFLNDNYKDVTGGIRPIDRIFILLNNIRTLNDIPVCKQCNKNHVLFLRSGAVGFSEVCSQECGVVFGGTKNGDPKVSKKSLENRKNTVRAKYKVDHISKLDYIKKIKKETAIKNYGSLKSAFYDTAQKTIHERYGVENISQHEPTKEKKIKTSIKNYGTDYPWQSEKGKHEQKQAVIDKYGVDNISKLDKIKEQKKETCIKNWGVDNYSKSIYFVESMIKDNNPNWRGGISNSDYCDIFILKEFKDMIKERDSKQCSNPACNKKDETDIVIHHIDYNKLSCHPSNLITICRSCNTAANYNREWHESWYKAIIIKRYGFRGL